MTDAAFPDTAGMAGCAAGRQPSLMKRVALIAGATGLAMCLAVATLIVLNARVAIWQETRTALQSAGATLGGGLRIGAPGEETGPLLMRLAAEFDALRHVSAYAVDAGGHALALPAGPAGTEAESDDHPPFWFSALMRHETESVDVPVLNAEGGVIGRLHLTTDPADEIEEVWEDFRVIIPLITLSAAVMVLIAVALCRVFLRRIRVLEAIVSDMRRGNLETRVPPMQAREFSDLGQGINDLAEFLARERADNIVLQQRILTIGEDERARIAFDLHDQMGPRLFALTSALEQIRSLTGRATDGAPLSEALEASLSHARAVQSMARSAINDLRPMVIGHVPLCEALEELVVEFAGLHPAPDIRLETGSGPLPALSEVAELSVYRFVRESVLNALRHGGADRITIRLEDHSGAPKSLLITVSDNGSGPGETPPQPGHGLSGIMDRALALGAVFKAPSRAGGLTVTSLRMPHR
ncbi:histidine kinase [Falsigemmobacter intermedius]|uniref:histidine kinase n=1 Tax=Falsigemmobacter intermedius TaxID=1553448 RepID=UPI003F05583F